VVTEPALQLTDCVLAAVGEQRKYMPFTLGHAGAGEERLETHPCSVGRAL
jgi:hypothetical protein